MKRIILAIAAIIFLLILIALLWGYFAFLSTKPLTKAQLAELTPDWSVITHDNWSPWFTEPDGTGSPKTTWNPAASFNAWLDTVPEQDKAWPIFVDVYYKNYELLNNSQGLGSLPGRIKDWDALKLKLEPVSTNGDIDRIIEAFTRPTLGSKVYGYANFEMQSIYSNATFDPIVLHAMEKWGIENPRLLEDGSMNPMLMSNEYEAATEHRALVRLVQSVGFMKLESGDIRGWISLMDAVSRSARFRLEIPTLINQFLAIAIKARVIEHIAVAINNDPSRFTDQELAALDAILERQVQEMFIWEGEALSQHDTVRRMTDAKGKYILSSFGGYSSFDPDVLVPCNLPDAELKKTAQRLLHTYNLSGMAIDTKIPWDHSTSQQYTDKITNARMPYIVTMMMDMFLLDQTRVGVSFWSIQQQRIAVRLAIAIERHRLRHGQYPQSRGDIDSDLLRVVPADVFGGMLEFKLTDEGPIIYSKSDDRDNDGGASMYKYDIDALFDTTPKSKTKMMTRYYNSKKESSGTRHRPLWITPDRVNEIKAIEPKAIDGDWTLYPLFVEEPDSDDTEDNVQDD